MDPAFVAQARRDFATNLVGQFPPEAFEGLFLPIGSSLVEGPSTPNRRAQVLGIGSSRTRNLSPELRGRTFRSLPANPRDPVTGRTLPQPAVSAQKQAQFFIEQQLAEGVPRETIARVLASAINTGFGQSATERTAVGAPIASPRPKPTTAPAAVRRRAPMGNILADIGSGLNSLADSTSNLAGSAVNVINAVNQVGGALGQNAVIGDGRSGRAVQVNQTGIRPVSTGLPLGSSIDPATGFLIDQTGRILGRGAATAATVQAANQLGLPRAQQVRGGILDVPGIDIVPDGASELFEMFGRRGATTPAKEFVAVNPTSGRAQWFRPAGRPLVWSSDLTACKRVKKLAARARRAQGGR